MERRTSTVDTALDSGGAWFQSFFGAFGRFIFKFGTITFIAFGLFLVGISFGLLDAREETRISELWVEEGTRLRDERQAVIDRWGPGGRLELISWEDVSGGNVATKQVLDSMLAVLTPILTNTNGNEFNVTTQGVSRKYNIYNLCDAPPVPTLFKAPGSLASGQFISYGFQALVSCIQPAMQSANAVAYGALTANGLMNTLPSTWGIERFPCTRISPLDCFAEGQFDYPSDLKLADGMGYVMNAAFSNSTSSRALLSAFTYTPGQLNDIALAGAACKLSISNTIDSTFLFINATSPSTYQTTIAGAKNFAIVQSLNIFGGFGYAWRKRYNSLTTTTQITKAIIDAYAFTSSPSVGLEECVGRGLNPAAPTDTCCLAWSGTKTPFQLVYGNVNGDKTSIGAMRAVINLFGEGSPVFEQALQKYIGLTPTQDEQADILKIWEQNFINYMKPFWERTKSGYKPGEANGNLIIKFLADRSISDIVEEGKSPESHLVIIGYLALLVYSCLSLVTWTGDCKSSLIESSAIVALAGIVIIMLSTVAGFGLVTVLGYDLSPISTNLVPFLSLGIGVDDMFVLIFTLRDHKHYPDAATRIEQSMAVAGPSVFLTSLTNACAFFIASLTPIPAVKTFVVQMGLTVIINLLSLLLMFVPVLVWDTHRHVNGKPDCLLCCFDGDSNYQSQVDNKDSVVKRFTNNYYAPALKHPVGKVIVLTVFLGLFGVMAYLGFAKVETGLRQSDIALRDSYQREYAKLNEDVYGSFSASLVTLSKTSSFSSTTGPNKQQTILDIMASLQASPYVSTDITVKDLSWLSDGQTTFLGFALAAGQTTSASTPVNPLAFNTLFQQWITSVGATSTGSMYCVKAATGVRTDCSAFDVANDRVEAVKQTIFNDNLLVHNNFIDTIEDNRARVDAIDAENSFMYGYIYQYWEQYLNIRDNLMTIVGWALLGVFLATFIFQFSPVTSLLVACTICMIVVEVFGTMYLIPVKLNAFSVVNLVMSVGLAVEFTAHISHVFLMKRGTRNDRMCAALDELMTPMLHGAVSSLLAVLVLAFARFPFFRDYYFSMFATMIVLAFANGMIFLPVVLSLIGPSEFSYAESTDKDINMHTVKSSTDVRDDTLDNTTL